MSFKRVFTISEYPSGEELSGKLIGLGFKIGGIKEDNPNIEDTIVAAAIDGMNGDYRTLSLLTDWLFIHSGIINIDRLFKALNELDDRRVSAYFSSIGIHFKRDPRFKKISTLYKKQRLFLEKSKSYEFLVSRNGEDDRFKNTKLIVARGTLRIRHDDIATPQEMAKLHKDYYYRMLIGPSFRADMVSCFLRERTISASELARKCYGSFATAWQVIRDINHIGEQI